LSEPEPKSVIEPVAEAEPAAEPEPVAEPAAEPEPVAEPAAEAEPTNENSHLFSVRTTGGQEKIVMRMLEARMKLDQNDDEEVEKAEEERLLYDSTKLYGAGDKIKINQTSLPKEEAILDMNITEKTLARFCFFTAKQAEKLDNEEDIEKAEEEQSIPRLLPPPKIAPDGKHSTNDPNWEEDFTTYPRVKNIQSVLLLDDLKGYVVVEADGASSMFNAVQGIRHVRGQLRGELGYDEIEKYLVKKSVVSELAVDNTVEIIGGPFKGMKATVTRVDKEKEEATVLLLDAPYQLPITVDANYLKLIPT